MHFLSMLTLTPYTAFDPSIAICVSRRTSCLTRGPSLSPNKATPSRSSKSASSHAKLMLNVSVKLDAMICNSSSSLE